MTDEQLNAQFVRIGDYLASVARNLDRVEAEQVLISANQARDQKQMEQGIARIGRLERLVKSLVVIGDRERKELRTKINALIDSHLRLEDKQEKIQESFDALLNSHILLEDHQRKAEEARLQSEKQLKQNITELKESQLQTQAVFRLSEESRRQFEQQMGQTVLELKESQRLTEESLRLTEESRRQFEQQVGTALAEMAQAIVKTNHRIDTIESNGHP
jgi:hypothetical protein